MNPKILRLLLAATITITIVACERRRTTTQTQGGTGEPSASESLEIGMPSASGIILFRDDFQDGQADDWSINTAWSVLQSGDSYLLSATGYGGAWLPQGLHWHDYVFRVGVRVDSGNLFLFTNMTQESRYILALSTEGTYLYREQPSDNLTLLAQAAPIATQTGHAITVANQNGHLQVYIDQVIWFDLTDSTPLLEGTIGVGAAENSRVAVDNILVMQLTSTLPEYANVVPPASQNQNPPAEEPNSAASLPLSQVEPPAEPPSQPEQPQTGQPDIQMVNVSITPSDPDQREAVSVLVSVANTGQAHAGAFNVRWMPEGSFVGCSWDVDGLPAGETLDLICSYQGYPDAGTFTWVALADADSEIAESNENNNQQSLNISVREIILAEAPPAPINCSGWALSATSVSISWEYPYNDAIEGFRIYQGTTSLELSVGFQFRGSNIENLAPDTQYHFDVRSYIGNVESPVDACFTDTSTNP